MNQIKPGPDGRRPSPRATVRRQWKRSELGRPGIEPYEERGRYRPDLAQGVALVAILVTLGDVIAVGAVLGALALGLGAPGRWARRHDRLSTALWSLAAVMWIVSVVLAAGGSTASLSSRSPGAGLLLLAVSQFIALLSFFRRWGTGGNMYYRSLKARRGRDPEASEMIMRDGEARDRARRRPGR